MLPPLFPFLKSRAGGRLCRAGSRADRGECASRSRHSCRSGFWSTGSGRGACWSRRCSAPGTRSSGSGCSPSYWHLLLAMALLGLANAVFHPADYALLSAQNSGDPARPRLLDPYLFRVSRQCRRAGHDARAGRVWRVELRADRGRYSRHRRRAAAGAGARCRGELGARRRARDRARQRLGRVGPETGHDRDPDPGDPGADRVFRADEPVEQRHQHISRSSR